MIKRAIIVKTPVIAGWRDDSYILAEVSAAYASLAKVSLRSKYESAAADKACDRFENAFKALKAHNPEKAKAWCALFNTHMSVEPIDLFA